MNNKSRALTRGVIAVLVLPIVLGLLRKTALLGGHEERLGPEGLQPVEDPHRAGVPDPLAGSLLPPLPSTTLIVRHRIGGNHDS